MEKMMFNLKKAKKDQGIDGLSHTDEMLENNRDAFNTGGNDGSSHYDRQLKDVRKDPDGLNNYERQLVETHKESKSDENMTIEAKMDKEKKVYNKRRDDTSAKLSTTPLGVLEQVRYNENVGKMNEAARKDTDFWDKYVGTYIPTGGKTKIVGNVQPSQLANKPERFNKTKEDLSNGDKIDPLVTAALKDADAIIFHTFLKAEMEDRKLTAQDISDIKKVEAEKEELISNNA